MAHVKTVDRSSKIVTRVAEAPTPAPVAAPAAATNELRTVEPGKTHRHRSSNNERANRMAKIRNNTDGNYKTLPIDNRPETFPLDVPKGGFIIDPTLALPATSYNKNRNVMITEAPVTTPVFLNLDDAIPENPAKFRNFAPPPPPPPPAVVITPPPPEVKEVKEVKKLSLISYNIFGTKGWQSLANRQRATNLQPILCVADGSLTTVNFTYADEEVALEAGKIYILKNVDSKVEVDNFPVDSLVTVLEITQEIKGVFNCSLKVGEANEKLRWTDSSNNLIKAGDKLSIYASNLTGADVELFIGY